MENNYIIRASLKCNVCGFESEFLPNGFYMCNCDYKTQLYIDINSYIYRIGYGDKADGVIKIFYDDDSINEIRIADDKVEHF
jgi:hypothetical protein